jgi:hypothetical protein
MYNKRMKILPLPPNRPQRYDCALQQLESVLLYAAQYCTHSEWLEQRLEVKRMYCERLGCYNARDTFFGLGSDHEIAHPKLTEMQSHIFS